MWFTSNVLIPDSEPGIEGLPDISKVVGLTVPVSGFGDDIVGVSEVV